MFYHKMLNVYINILSPSSKGEFIYEHHKANIERNFFKRTMSEGSANDERRISEQ